jgi:hypothetical protein
MSPPLPRSLEWDCRAELVVARVPGPLLERPALAFGVGVLGGALLAVGEDCDVPPVPPVPPVLPAYAARENIRPMAAIQIRMSVRKFRVYPSLWLLWDGRPSVRCDEILGKTAPVCQRAPATMKLLKAISAS